MMTRNAVQVQEEEEEDDRQATPSPFNFFHRSARSRTLESLMWILLSLFSGLSDATRDAISKRSSGTIPHVMISWSYSLFALPFFLPVLLLSAPSELPLEFWLLAIGIGAAHVLGSLGVVYSLSRSELSLCVPMTAFSPVFLLVIGPMMNGHAPSSHAILGTVLVTAGCYLLNISDIRRGLLAPVVSLAREPGVRMMLLLSVFWSFSAAIDLNAVRKFGLPFWAASELFAIAILFVPVVIYKKGLKGMTPMGWRTLPLIGMANACSFGPYLLALSSTHALYVICLKRSNIFFSLLVGRLMFGEDSLRGRLIGASLMFAGVAVISLWG